MKILTRLIAVLAIAALPLTAAAEGVQVADAKLGKGVQMGCKRV